MADPNPQTLARLAAEAASGALRIPVTATYPLDRVGEAFAAFAAGTLGKVAITHS
jgi:NADPH:quinone reductase-like Zn-dependent oxidoreductase